MGSQGSEGAVSHADAGQSTETGSAIGQDLLILSGVTGYPAKPENVLDPCTKKMDILSCMQLHAHLPAMAAHDLCVRHALSPPF